MKFSLGFVLASIAIPLCLAPLNAACGATDAEEEETFSASSAIDATEFPSGTYSITAGTTADGAIVKATIKWQLADDGITGDAELTGTATDTKKDGMSACLRVQYGGAKEYEDVGCESRGAGQTSKALTWSGKGIKKFPYVTACVDDRGTTPEEKAKVPVCKGGKTTLVAKDAPDAGTEPAPALDAGTEAATPAPIPTPAPSAFAPPPSGE